jgi:hypothetical protein
MASKLFVLAVVALFAVAAAADVRIALKIDPFFGFYGPGGVLVHGVP